MSASRAVLLVEDDPDVTEPLSEILREEGYEVSYAATLGAGREALRTSKPDVVLIDLMLVDESAETLLEEMAMSAEAPPAVLMSGRKHASSVAERFGIPFLQKPFELDALVAAVYASVTGRRRPMVGARS
jgi:DNA-binding response OmpR family regulator